MSILSGAKGERKERLYPMPELLDGGEWKINDVPGQPNVELNGRGGGGVMNIPLGESVEERWIKMHEMGHAKWSPRRVSKTPAGVPEYVVEACEDLRINKKLSNSGALDHIPVVERYSLSVEEIQGAFKRAEKESTDLFLASLMASKIGTYDSTRIAEVAEEMYGEEVRHKLIAMHVDIYNISQEFNSSLNNYKRYSIEIAKKLVEKYGSPEPEESETEEQQAPKSERFQMQENRIQRMIERAEETNLLDEDGEIAYGSGQEPWGPMEIISYPLTTSLPAKIRSIRDVASDMGTYPKNIDRYCTDKNIFSKKIRKHGGAVLIDGSGSMSWSHEELMETLKLMPAAVVAIYSGTVVDEEGEAIGTYGENGHYDGFWGGLRIIAKNGRAVAPDWDCWSDETGSYKRYYYGNEVDAPALRWLAKQKGVKFWVSDGAVCNSFGNTLAQKAEAFEVYRRNKIIRIEHLPEIRENLKAIYAGKMKR